MFHTLEIIKRALPFPQNLSLNITKKLIQHVLTFIAVK